MYQHSWCYLRIVQIYNTFEKYPLEWGTICIYASSRAGQVEILAFQKPNIVVCFMYSLYVNNAIDI